ncbi:hypothetical protein GQ54DRAFT_295227 [Martensiomyces pterosporus]|nr:hypothetical protein GQ54DRAFT_295227 [Martensiomyces pterosporus]
MALPDSESSGAKLPIGGRYVALLRRTQTVFLFSDPIFVADGQGLPELPDGLQYIFIHPSSSAAADAKPHTMSGYLPADALKADTDAHAFEKPVQGAALLPVEEFYGAFSSFLPTHDSSLSTLSARDISVLGTLHAEEARVSDADLTDALELADKVLAESAATSDGRTGVAIDAISPEVLQDLGLCPSVLGASDSSDTGDASSPASEESETAASILETNRDLLVKLAEAQDRRAQEGDFGKISEEEKAVAKRLQENLARVVSAHGPAAFRPPTEEIHRASQMLLAGSASTMYSGTLPPQRRFAFISNAATYAGFPPGATTAPMARDVSQTK